MTEAPGERSTDALSTVPQGFVSPSGRRFVTLGLGEASARIVGFIATAYVARQLGADTYGVLVWATTVVLYLTFVADAGWDMIGVREVATQPQGVGTLLEGVIGSRLAVVAVILMGTTTIGVWLYPSPEGRALALCAGTLATTAIGTRWVHVGLDRSRTAAWSRVLSEVITALLILLSVRRADHFLRVPVAQFAGELFAALFLLWRLPTGARPTRLTVSVARVVQLVRNGWPMMLHGLLGLAIFNSDFLFLRAWFDAATVGVYAVAYTLVSFFQNLGTAFTLSLIPGMTTVRDDHARTQALHDGAIAQALAATLPVVVGGILVAQPLITLLFGSAYSRSVLPLQLLLLLVPIAWMRNVFQAVLVARERQDRMLYTVVGAASLNLLLNIVLIPRFGLEGAALATVCTEAIRLLLARYFCRDHLVFLRSPWRIAPLLVATGLMALVVWPLRTQVVLLSIPAGVLAFVAALTITGTLRWRRGALPVLHV